MKIVIPFLLFTALATSSCDKSEVEKTEQGTMPVTNAVKTGDWMVTYFENNASMDIGVTYLKFNSTGSLVATIDGTPFNGVWTEAKTNGSNALTINITTTDVKLKQVNGTWQVTNVSEYYIDLKNPDPASKIILQLMKH